MYCLFALGVEYFQTQSTKTLCHTGLLNDHEMDLWRSQHYMCTYCKQSVLIMRFKNESWRRLVFKETSNKPGTYIRVETL